VEAKVNNFEKIIGEFEKQLVTKIEAVTSDLKEER
jgi:hypothetical protein